MLWGSVEVKVRLDAIKLGEVFYKFEVFSIV